MPTFLQLRVTNLCNLRCKMCGQWGDTGVFREQKGDGATDGEVERARIRELIGLRRQLALDDYERLLDEVAPHKPIVSLFGGEPFLYPDIIPLVRAIKERGLVATVITNGWHLERHARELVEAGMDSIAVSIDGPPDVHDRIRGRESSFARAAAGIRAVAHWREKLGRGLPVQMAILPVTELNAADVPAALDALRELPLELVNVGLRWFVPPAGGRGVRAGHAGDLRRGRLLLARLPVRLARRRRRQRHHAGARLRPGRGAPPAAPRRAPRQALGLLRARGGPRRRARLLQRAHADVRARPLPGGVVLRAGGARRRRLLLRRLPRLRDRQREVGLVHVRVEGREGAPLPREDRPRAPAHLRALLRQLRLRQVAAPAQASAHWAPSAAALWRGRRPGHSLLSANRVDRSSFRRTRSEARPARGGWLRSRHAAWRPGSPPAARSARWCPSSSP